MDSMFYFRNGSASLRTEMLTMLHAYVRSVAGSAASDKSPNEHMLRDLAKAAAALSRMARAKRIDDRAAAR